MPTNHHKRTANNDIQLEKISEELNELSQLEVARMLAEKLASLKEVEF